MNSVLWVVRSTCPYCGVGCQIDLHVKDDRIFRVDAPFDVAPNFGRLCVKGRFGTDFVGHPSRLTVPLIRKKLRQQRPPQMPGSRTPAASPDDWREASWDEALDLVAARLLDLRRRYGPDSITANAWPRPPTKTTTCSRSICAWSSARTTSITAPGCATRAASRAAARPRLRAR